MATPRSKTHERRGAGRPQGAQPAPRVSLRVPLAALAVAVVVLTAVCRQLLIRAAAGDAATSAELPIYLAAACFLLAAGAVVVLQAVRTAERIAGPEYRLRQTLQRIRSGDLSFRVHLRKGDLLTGLADECNALLEWLNHNPPRGARIGSDMVVVAEVAEAERADAGRRAAAARAQGPSVEGGTAVEVVLAAPAKELTKAQQQSMVEAELFAPAQGVQP